MKSRITDRILALFYISCLLILGIGLLKPLSADGVGLSDLMFLIALGSTIMMVGNSAVHSDHCGAGAQYEPWCLPCQIAKGYD